MIQIDILAAFDHSNATTIYDVVFGVPERERATTTTTRCCLWGTSSLQVESAFTDDSHHFGDRTHVTYSYGLDCEKQEHWNGARNHNTVYLASLR